MRKTTGLVALIGTSSLLLALQGVAQADYVGNSLTTNSSGEGEVWTTYPYLQYGNPTLRITDYAADGYGVRVRERSTVASLYEDMTLGAGDYQDFTVLTRLTHIQACNRDKLSNGTVSVFNCDSWRSTPVP